MRRVYSILLVGGVSAVLALAGCGGGGGGNGGNDPPPPEPEDVVISGTVVSSQNQATGVPGVEVSLGTAGYQYELKATTNASGNFSMTLPDDKASPLQLYATIPFDFRVNTAGAGSSFPTFLPVWYNAVKYDQNPVMGYASIPVPAAVLVTTESMSLGTIVVTFFDPNQPPPPPL